MTTLPHERQAPLSPLAGHSQTLQTYPVITVPYLQLRPASFIARTEPEDPEALKHMALSIHVNTEYGADGEITISGVQVPLLARPGHPGDIALGRRRWEAVQLYVAGFEMEIDGETHSFKATTENYPIPVQFRPMTDDDMIAAALRESLHTAPLTELDRADLCVALHVSGFDYAAISRKINSSVATVERLITLGYRLGRDGRELLRNGTINLREARLLCRASGDLRQTLIAAVKSGMSTNELVSLVQRSSVQVENAWFDVEKSGLSVLPKLYEDGLPAVFTDAHAALALNLQAVQQDAEKWRADTGQWTEIRAVEGDPTILPADYQVGDGEECGRVYVYTTFTGQIHVHDGVQHLTQPVRMKAVKAGVLPTAEGQQANRLSGVKDWVLKEAQGLKAAALADMLMANPKVGLVNAILQMMRRGSNITVGGMSGAQRAAAEQVQGFAARMAAQHPKVFVNHSLGLLQLRRECSMTVALHYLLGLETEELLSLLTFYSCGSAFDQEDSGAEHDLAELLEVNHLIAERFHLTPEMIQAHSRIGLEGLIASMPEQVRPIIEPGTHSKPELKNIISERLGRLKMVGWLPPYAKL